MARYLSLLARVIRQRVGSYMCTSENAFSDCDENSDGKMKVVISSCCHRLSQSQEKCHQNKGKDAIFYIALGTYHLRYLIAASSELFTGDQDDGKGFLPSFLQLALAMPKNDMHILPKQKESAVGPSKECSLADAIMEWKEQIGILNSVVHNSCANGLASQGQLSEAIDAWKISAAYGSNQAYFNLGVCSEYGKGIEKDVCRAKSYYREAALRGHVKAQFNLGLICLRESGDCSDSDDSFQLALKLLTSAAQGGLKEAQRELGIIHFNHPNLSDGRAVHLFGQAAEQKDSASLYYSALCYEYGLGVPHNGTKCRNLMEQSARLGFQLAKDFLESERSVGGGESPVSQTGSSSDLCVEVKDFPESGRSTDDDKSLVCQTGGGSNLCIEANQLEVPSSTVGSCNLVDRAQKQAARLTSYTYSLLSGSTTLLLKFNEHYMFNSNDTFNDGSICNLGGSSVNFDPLASSVPARAS